MLQPDSIKSTSILVYNVDLSEKVSDILNSDFWMLRDFYKWMIANPAEPIKFSSNVSVFIHSGNITGELDLIKFSIDSPSIVNLRSGQILQIKDCSDDLHCSFIVMSQRFIDHLFVLLQDCRAYNVASLHQIVKLDNEVIRKLGRFYDCLEDVYSDKKNPYSYQSITLLLSSFFLEIAHKCYDSFLSMEQCAVTGLPDRFLSLVQKHFKEHRYLEFYSEKLGISSKHLSRTIKKSTGFTAVDWIERYVILEAKVLLKSSVLTIQQIAEDLNFPSQSYFGKFFKKKVGLSPLQFRNT